MPETPLDDLSELGYKDQIIYAGWWQRAAALIVDIIICYAILLVLVVPAALVAQFWRPPNDVSEALIGLAGLMIFWLYFALMESSAKQATLGKRWLGIKVVNLQQERISFAQATGRFFGKILSYLILYLGFIIAAFSDRKQALHDMLAKTLVVKKSQA